MNKRGQIYLLAAIIFAIAIYGVSSIVNKAEQQGLKGDFEKLSENYEAESKIFINSLLGETSLDTKFEAYAEFTAAFTSYSKSQDSSFGLIYAYSSKVSSNIYRVEIGNFLDQSIGVTAVGTGGETNVNGCYEKVGATIDLGQDISFTSPIYYSIISDCIYSNDLPLTQLSICIRIGDVYYPLEINPEAPQVMVVSRLEEGEQRKVFIGGEGFKEGGSAC